MMKSRPLSPPILNNEEQLQTGFQHLVPNNSSTSFSRGPFSYEDSVQRPRLLYGSPPTIYQEDLGHQIQQPMYTYPNKSPGRRLQYNALPQYSPETVQYGIPQSELQAGQFTTPAGSPSAHSMPTPGSDAIRTRSGLAIDRNIKSPSERKARVTRSPKSKKVRKGRAKAENRIAKLDLPLSVLTRDWDHVPIVDIEAYVNRPVEQRRREVEEAKVPGKVKRPMNSFMLYRKAYQLRTKTWCLENNHQVVSQVCGDSWPLEPEELRNQFSEWAKTERENHQKAHPGYKFSPSKPGASKAKLESSDEVQSEESDLEDYDWERGQTKRPRKQQKSNQTPDVQVQRPTRSPFSISRDSSMEPSFGTHNRSSYQTSNPGKQLPAQYNQAQLRNGQYYQQSVHNSLAVPGAEDIVIRKTPTPGTQYLDHPGDQKYGIVSQYQTREGSAPPEQIFQPSFMRMDSSLFDDQYMHEGALFYGDHMNTHLQWHAPYDMIDPELQNDAFVHMGSPQPYDTLQIHDQHMQRLNNSQEGWQIEPLDAGQEFDKWMNEE